jgi:integrase
MSIITDRQMQAKANGKDQWLSEDAPKGHGRFTGRITRSGDRLFYFRYTDPDGKRTWVPIGAYDPAGNSGLTLKSARERAGELSKLYQSGVVDLKRHLEAEHELFQAQRQAEQARLEAANKVAAAEAARQSARITVRSLFERWASVDLIRRKDGGKEIRRMFEKDVLPKIGVIAVEDIRKGHITGVTDPLLARGVNRMAKLIFSLMRQMFRFAVDRDILEADPTASIRKAKIGGKDTERDRRLSEDEIKLLALKLPDAELMHSTECAVWLALSTCCRIGELLTARWDRIDFDKRTWLIPAEYSKNGRPHTIWLSDFALAQFQRLHTINGTTPWCYPDRTGTRAVSTKTVTKQLGDRQRDAEPMSGRSKAVGTLKLSGGLWTPHDLRRTGATQMTALGVLPEVAERCLNHTEENKVKRIYQRHSYEAEMRKAWRRLGAWLQLLTSSDTDNVVALHRAA